MEFFRWILILSGVVLLCIAYLMGRKKVKTSVYHRAVPDAYDPSLDELSVPIGDFDTNDTRDAFSEEGAADWQNDVSSSARGDRFANPLNDGVDERFLTDEEIDATLPPTQSYANGSDQVAFGVGDRSSSHADGEMDDASPKSFASAVKQAARTEPQESVANSEQVQADRNFSEEFETYPEETTVKLEDFEEKLVTVHVVAARDRRFFGNDLKAVFDEHGYRFGRMSLYHCTLEGDRVFSIANMVKPGTFDEQALDDFATPGITLFMRLPIELDADVAFDFLIREAQELADELGGHLRDVNRNPLSSQTIQHIREDIQQYVFGLGES